MFESVAEGRCVVDWRLPTGDGCTVCDYLLIHFVHVRSCVSCFTDGMRGATHVHDRKLGPYLGACEPGAILLSSQFQPV